MNNDEQIRPDDVITTQEREHLLYGLRRFLVWVGEKPPERMQIDGRDIELHELIWRCIQKKGFSEDEKSRFMGLIRTLETKEKIDEETLARTELTRKEAMELYHETAALIRAIIDLRECEEGKIKLLGATEETRQKVDDARRWMGFLKNIGKKVEES